jgi:hypothetical protein
MRSRTAIDTSGWRSLVSFSMSLEVSQSPAMEIVARVRATPFGIPVADSAPTRPPSGDVVRLPLDSTALSVFAFVRDFLLAPRFLGIGNPYLSRPRRARGEFEC